MKATQLALILFALIIIVSCNQNGQLPKDVSSLNLEPCWNTAGSAGTIDEGIQDYISMGHGAGVFLPHDKAITNEHNHWLPFDAVAYVNHDAPDGHYSIRYNIGQLVEHIPNKDDQVTMRLRYLVRDKTKERVIVILKRYEIEPDNPNNQERANSIILFDSYNHDASPSFQTQSKSVTLSFDEFFGAFNFQKYVYFVEALLIKYVQDNDPTVPRPGAPSPPAIGAIQLCVETVVD